MRDQITDSSEFHKLRANYSISYTCRVVCFRFILEWVQFGSNKQTSSLSFSFTRLGTSCAAIAALRAIAASITAMRRIKRAFTSMASGLMRPDGLLFAGCSAASDGHRLCRAEMSAIPGWLRGDSSPPFRSAKFPFRDCPRPLEAKVWCAKYEASRPCKRTAQAL